jgi:hypothetical protein
MASIRATRAQAQAEDSVENRFRAVQAAIAQRQMLRRRRTETRHTGVVAEAYLAYALRSRTFRAAEQGSGSAASWTLVRRYSWNSTAFGRFLEVYGGSETSARESGLSITLSSSGLPDSALI